MTKTTIELTQDWDYRPDTMTTVEYLADKKYSVDDDTASAAQKTGYLKGPKNGKRTSKGSAPDGIDAPESGHVDN